MSKAFKKHMAIQGQAIMAIKERQRFQCLAAPELPQDTLAYWAEPLGGDGVKYLAPVGVARDPLNPVDGTTGQSLSEGKSGCYFDAVPKGGVRATSLVLWRYPSSRCR